MELPFTKFSFTEKIVWLNYKISSSSVVKNNYLCVLNTYLGHSFFNVILTFNYKNCRDRHRSLSPITHENCVCKSDDELTRIMDIIRT